MNATPLEIARADVLEKSRIWLRERRKITQWSDSHKAWIAAERELLEAVTLMVSREAMNATSHLDSPAHPFEVGQ